MGCASSIPSNRETKNTPAFFVPASTSNINHSSIYPKEDSAKRRVGESPLANRKRLSVDSINKFSQSAPLSPLEENKKMNYDTKENLNESFGVDCHKNERSQSLSRLSHKAIVRQLSCNLNSAEYQKKKANSVASINLDFPNELKDIKSDTSSGQFYLTVIKASYDDFNCTEELDNQVTCDDELSLIGGAHKYLLQRKPHYYRLFEMDYCYQSEVMQISKRIDEIKSARDQISLKAPSGHELNILRAVIGDKDFTDHIRHIVNAKDLTMFNSSSKSFKDLLESEDLNDLMETAHVDSDGDDSMAGEDSHSLVIHYVYQTPKFSISCHGNEDILIPSYQTTMSLQPNEITSSVALQTLYDPIALISKLSERPTIAPAHQVSTKHINLANYFQGIESPGVHAPPTVVKAIPATMTGFMSKETAPKNAGEPSIWVNRYFVLDSSDILAHLSYYRTQSSRSSQGKDIKGEVSLLEYSLTVHNTKIVLKSKLRPGEGLVLDVKEGDVRRKWVKSFKDHMEYAEIEKRKSISRKSLMVPTV